MEMAAMVADIIPEIALVVGGIVVLLYALAAPRRYQTGAAALALATVVLSTAASLVMLAGPQRLTFADTYARDGAAVWAKLIVLLGTEAGEKGVRFRSRISGGCMWKAASCQSDSLGIRRLAPTPTYRAESLPKIVPICSTQPPTNATPYIPKTNTPFARVDSRVPPAIESVMTSVPSSSISGAPTTTPGGVNPVMTRAETRTPPTRSVA